MALSSMLPVGAAAARGGTLGAANVAAMGVGRVAGALVAPALWRRGGMALVAGVGIGAHALATVVSCAAFRVWRRAAPPGARAARKEEPP